MEHFVDKNFNSIDNKHQIETSIIDNICWFNINKFDFENYKTFLLTLKDVLIYLKKNNIIYIKQHVYEEDIEYFKNSSIINTDENKYTITTNIDVFVDEMVNVLGIRKI
jgi:hypothetical protein